ncbi:MAG: hypothetical protein OQK57_10155 [Ignavibacteriaceae bacterium]|jgi:quinol monooxygenase YgiN|nr:hypothetical protein [Ignavibacteriaceae bacterium]
MIKKLELIVEPKTHNRKEFSQSLENLAENLQIHCSSLIIDDSGDGNKFNILAQWETEDQMSKALRSEEFRIFFGAIGALCDKTIVRLDGKKVSNNFLKIK